MGYYFNDETNTELVTSAKERLEQLLIDSEPEFEEF